jgi:hypothetical protein
MKYIILTGLTFLTLTLTAQVDRWQQRVEYKMDVELNDENHQITGTQELTYYNNSPDELNEVFYYLFFNAFQPGSMMDVRSQSIEDPDSRVGDRIGNLSPDKQGFLHVKSLRMNGKKVDFEEVGTILEVKLPKAIKPGSKVKFEMEFEGQVPLQIRRSGRNNKEGIAYSMSQWYPKMCEYDYEGWHANPYVGREFHGVWGDYEVNITMDKEFIIGGTGVLQNPNEIGYGYAEDESKVKRPKGDKLTWKFVAENVHDFVWAADEDYLHDKVTMENGPDIHFFYQNDTSIVDNWKELQDFAPKVFEYMNEHFGKYPYSTYSVIQGGDGGMEYPMATLITGKRNKMSLFGVFVHEMAHSWYQAVLATNESLYEWMDEGFTSYASEEVMAHLFDKPKEEKHRNAYGGYYYIVDQGKENPMTTHADHYETNLAYGIAAYSKGQVFVEQLKYVVGEETLKNALLTYFNTWKFKHPNPNDFKRVVEKESGLELDWYFQYFVQSTRTIDYAIKEVRKDGNSTYVTLEKIGLTPMPIDVQVTYKDGSSEMFYIPLQIMRGEKPAQSDMKRTVLEDWPWVEQYYLFEIDKNGEEISSITIDPSRRMADIELENNSVDLEDGVIFKLESK